MDSNRFVRVNYPREVPLEVKEKKVDNEQLKPALLTRQPRWSGRGHSSGSFRAARMPPTVDTVAKAHSTLRFTATSAAASTNVTVATLLVACGSIATIANSTVTSVASSLKLHKITIWPASTTAGSGQNAEILWSDLGGITKDESKSTAIPAGVTVADVVSERPPKVTQAAFWQSSAGGASALFALTCPAGSIIDVSVSWTLRNNLSGVTQAGYAAATLGNFYYGRLDGVGGKFLPLGVPTTN
jgi:hypothetical protein